MTAENKTQRILDQWTRNAFNDLKAAKLLIHNNEYLLGVFHLQQSCEKYLKAYILKHHQIQPPRLHNLIRLLEVASLTLECKQHITEFFIELNSYYINARYPSDLEDLEKQLSKEKSEQYLQLTEEVKKWLEQKMMP